MHSEMFSDHDFMQIALTEARKAAAADEVPVGAVLTDEKGGILAVSNNSPLRQCDPTAHAEILALRKAAQKIRNYRLLHTRLYVTVEPCIMCMGAIIHARVSRIVFGAWDTKWGAAGSLYDFSGDGRLNHCPEINGGVLEKECREMMQHFFREKRRQKKKE
ncbi:MAG: tRNA adenosine(34) deaminase TadA [Desulfococcaceae bacterium]|nr:tRNA adenosine(34) deaminase TadA [Desulfococcaceae bacterium]